MSTGTAQQLDQIQAMMQAGHRSIRIERHTLVLWGLAAAFLVLFVNDLFPKSLLPDRGQRLLVHNLFIAAVLLCVGVVDYRLTLRRRRERRESLSYLQRQVMKIWWMLIALIVLIHIGVNLFGGLHLFLGTAIVLTGLAVFINGLFSAQPLKWAGILLMLIGLALLPASLPLSTQEWITASVYGVGLPALAWLLDRPAVTKSPLSQFAYTALWLAVVLAPAATAVRWLTPVQTPTGSFVTLAQYLENPQRGRGEWVVSLPAGTELPVHWQVTGPAVEPIDAYSQPIRLSKKIDLVFVDGQPDGRFRIADGDWKLRRLHSRVQIWRLSPVIDPAKGLNIDLRARMIETHW